MTTSLRIVYAGTPEFAVAALAALCASDHQVVAAYTQPDRPAGRGRVLTASAVKQYAQAHSMVVEQPLNFRDPAAIEHLRSYAPDVLVVAAYGLILPQAVLDIPRLACLNIHASLLPRWRGAAPIQRAILAGDAETGVTIMRMEAGLDTGPMLKMQGFALTAHDTAASVHDRLSALGATLLLDVLAELPAALQHATAQPEAGISYAKKISKEEAQLDWSQSAEQLDRKIRAFNPWPIAETQLHGQQLRVWQAQVISIKHREVPGTVLAATANGIQVACGTGVLSLTHVQQSGRKTLSAIEFIKSHSLTGVQLGASTGKHS
ncbi:MAG: methionyl-tRNA formyltransferase [Steroidobacteraceae bacterium]